MQTLRKQLQYIQMINLERESKPRRYQIGQCQTRGIRLTQLRLQLGLLHVLLRLELTLRRRLRLRMSLVLSRGSRRLRQLPCYCSSTAARLNAGRIEEHGRGRTLDIVHLAHQFEAIAFRGIRGISGWVEREVGFQHDWVLECQENQQKRKQSTNQHWLKPKLALCSVYGNGNGDEYRRA